MQTDPPPDILATFQKKLWTEHDLTTAKKRPMTPTEFKAARKKLGLSVKEMATMLGMAPTQIRRMEIRPELTSHRPVMPTTERLLRAWLDGYRPKNWPD